MTDMVDVLRAALSAADAKRQFAAREILSRRVGKQTIITTGLGSALSKGVREGFLVVVREGTRRRGRRYAITDLGKSYLQDTRTSRA